MLPERNILTRCKDGYCGGRESCKEWQESGLTGILCDYFKTLDPTADSQTSTVAIDYSGHVPLVLQLVTTRG